MARPISERSARQPGNRIFDARRAPQRLDLRGDVMELPFEAGEIRTWHRLLRLR
jgi:hypothetical protein